MESKIQFKSERSLGTILTDTFKFIRVCAKPLFGLLLRIAGPALLLLLLSYLFYMQSTLGQLDDPTSFQSDTFGVSIILSILFLIFSVIAYNALLYGTTMYAIRSYVDNNGTIVKSEVIQGIRKRFWGLMGMSFLSSIIIGLGFIFCIVPGFYLGTVLAMCFAVMIFEDRGVSDTISYCFELIKGDFWMTFATLLVTWLLYYFIMMIFSVPQYIYLFAKGIAFTETITGDPADMFDAGYIAINGIALIGQYVGYILLAIVSAFVYFNLNEKKHFTGTMETIDAIGNRDMDNV